MISHLGALISVVNGILLARQFSGDKEAIGAASIGDGATSTGAFHEALNQAAIEKLQEYRTALITAAVTGKIDVRPVAK